MESATPNTPSETIAGVKQLSRKILSSSKLCAKRESAQDGKTEPLLKLFNAGHVFVAFRRIAST